MDNLVRNRNFCFMTLSYGMLIIAFCQLWVTALSPILTLFLKIYLYSFQVLKVLKSRNFFVHISTKVMIK